MPKSRPIYHQRQLACERSYSNMSLKMYGGLGPAINSQNYHKLNSNGNNELASLTTGNKAKRTKAVFCLEAIIFICLRHKITSCATMNI